MIWQPQIPVWVWTWGFEALLKPLVTLSKANSRWNMLIQNYWQKGTCKHTKQRSLSSEVPVLPPKQLQWLPRCLAALHVRPSQTCLLFRDLSCSHVTACGSTQSRTSPQEELSVIGALNGLLQLCWRHHVPQWHCSLSVSSFSSFEGGIGTKFWPRLGTERAPMRKILSDKIWHGMVHKV